MRSGRRGGAGPAPPLLFPFTEDRTGDPKPLHPAKASASRQSPARSNARASPARIHQHLGIGRGEVGRDTFFSTLRELNFDGVASACVFAWEERAHESSAFMLDRITKELAG